TSRSPPASSSAASATRTPGPRTGRASCSPSGATMPCSPTRRFETAQAEGQHRDHAIVEQVFADWYDGPLAHFPSSVFNANAAWRIIAAMAQNLVRAAGTLAGPLHAKARAATIRRDLIDVAARTARHGRGHLTLHLPERWHRGQEWLNLWHACGPP